MSASTDLADPPDGAAAATTVQGVEPTGASAPSGPASPARPPRPARHAWWAAGAIGVVATIALQLFYSGEAMFPDGWNLHIGDWVNERQRWVRDNRLSHPLWAWFFNPISDSIEWFLNSIADGLMWLPWFVLPLIVFLLIARTGKWGTAVLAAACVIYPAMVGLWEDFIATLTLMIVSVALSVILGIPLGILAAKRRRAETAIRPFLDAMQTIPSTVYLVPVVLFFGVGPVAAAIATVVYALPPMVRLTTLGIRQVPADTVEASQMFGANSRQTLLKVELPQAVPSIMAGINQTINMALGIVVIASFVAAGGLGQSVQQSLKFRSPGRGLVASAAIVCVAIILDRSVRSFLERPQRTPKGARTDHEGAPAERSAVSSWRVATTGWRGWALATVAVGAAIAIGKAVGADAFPWEVGRNFADPVDTAVLWIRDTFDWLTQPINDFVVADVIVATKNFLLESTVWPVLVAVPAVLALFLRRWWLAIGSAVGVLLTGATGLWPESIDTLVQVIVAVIIAVAVAIPLGIALGRAPKAEKAFGPVLDALQTVPSMVYAVPFVMIFAVGPFPGLVASVLYAIPPGIRLTALGIRNTEGPAVEAATTFGATKRQVMWGVRVPLAMPSIILAVNQVIMMVLAMVIIAGFVGGGAIGFAAVEALTRPNTGLGIEVAIVIVAMAMILDRLTQALAQRFEPPSQRS